MARSGVKIAPFSAVGRLMTALAVTSVVWNGCGDSDIDGTPLELSGLPQRVTSGNASEGTDATSSSSSSSGSASMTASSSSSSGGPSSSSSSGQTTPTTITITVLASGPGRVTSSPTGIVCGAGATACTATFPTTALVALTATPNNGGSHTWSVASCPGSATGASTCNVSGVGSRTIGVAFTAPAPPCGGITQTTTFTPAMSSYVVSTTNCTSAQVVLVSSSTCAPYVQLQSVTVNNDVAATFTNQTMAGAYLYQYFAIAWPGGVRSAIGNVTLVASPTTTCATSVVLP